VAEWLAWLWLPAVFLMRVIPALIVLPLWARRGALTIVWLIATGGFVPFALSLRLAHTESASAVLLVRGIALIGVVVLTTTFFVLGWRRASLPRERGHRG
jgi:hypothetical protein